MEWGHMMSPCLFIIISDCLPSWNVSKMTPLSFRENQKEGLKGFPKYSNGEEVKQSHDDSITNYTLFGGERVSFFKRASSERLSYSRIPFSLFISAISSCATFKPFTKIDSILSISGSGFEYLQVIPTIRETGKLTISSCGSKMMREFRWRLKEEILLIGHLLQTLTRKARKGSEWKNSRK